jgi:hypothetical protein
VTERVEVTIHIQGQSGDKKMTISWDTKNKAAVEASRQTFLDLEKRGFVIYECKKVLGLFKKKGKKVTKYDPTAGEFIYEEPKDGSSHQEKEFDQYEVHVEQEIRFEDGKEYVPSKDGNPKEDREYLAMTGLRAG